MVGALINYENDSSHCKSYTLFHVFTLLNAVCMFVSLADKTREVSAAVQLINNGLATPVTGLVPTPAALQLHRVLPSPVNRL